MTDTQTESQAETKIDYRVDIQTASGGKMTYITEKREKAEVYFSKANAAVTNVYGIIGTVTDDGEWDEVIETFERREED